MVERSEQLSEDGSYSITVANGEYNVRVVDSNSKPVGQPIKLTVDAPKNLDIDVGAPAK